MNIEDQVVSLVCKIAGKRENLDKSAHLHNDLGFDSMDMADLILSCEQTFQIGIPDEKLEKCATVSDVIETVKLISNNH